MSDEFRMNHPTAAPGISPYLGPEWSAQRKLDGVRFVIFCGADGLPERGQFKGGAISYPPEGFKWRFPIMYPHAILDGEITSSRGWQGTLALIGQKRWPSFHEWTAFDVVSEKPFHQRIQSLHNAGFRVAPSYGNVHVAWKECLNSGWEGIVVKHVHGGYHQPSFKIKPERVFNAFAIAGHLIVLDEDKQPHTVARCAGTWKGPVRVSCEGVTEARRVRAAKVLANAQPHSDFSIRQLDDLRFT